MLWEFEFRSETPLYLQIRNQVVLSISGGELKPGDRLPTIRALSEESGINMMTVSKAYRLLKAEGYVRTDRRSGTVIAQESREHPDKETVARLRLVLAELQAQGLSREAIRNLCETCLKEEKETCSDD